MQSTCAGFWWVSPDMVYVCKFLQGFCGKKNSITSRQQSLTRNHASNEAEYMSQKPSLIHDWCRHTQFMCTNFWGEVYNTVEYVFPLLGKPWFPQQDHPKKNNFTFFLLFQTDLGNSWGWCGLKTVADYIVLNIRNPELPPFSFTTFYYRHMRCWYG